MKIDVEIDPRKTTKHQIAWIELKFPGQLSPVVIDVDGTTILKVCREVPSMGQDFLLIAAIVYAIDKAVDRSLTEDHWTRDLNVTFPVQNPDRWKPAKKQLGRCLQFLTGDRWTVSFRMGESRLIRKKYLKKPKPIRKLMADAVCLFSGGLDSYIGAVDWLARNPTGQLMLCGHYDGDVPGPRKDQESLGAELLKSYGNRFERLETRVGLSSGGMDTNFRGRSFLFLALGIYYAALIGRKVPVIIPENGAIALNFPLTPTRRGALSTRTVHPGFIRLFNGVLVLAGVKHKVVNPYALKTKGEMVTGCKDPKLLRRTYPLSRSCARFSHRVHWDDRKARSCGSCVPCLFRRASLFPAGWDDEKYGISISRFKKFDELPTDVLALCAFLRRDHSDAEIDRGLLANGSIPLGELPAYRDVVVRMRQEVRDWMKMNGSPLLRKLSQI
jgi:hypothetical protein